MAAYQICVRCDNRWPVTYEPRQWCPACQGLLLSPVDTRTVTPPSRRNFRWVARPPRAARRTAPRVRAAAATAPPAYDRVPQWGLRDTRPDTDDEPTHAETLSDLAPTLLAGTAAVFALAAVAEGVRYALLLFNRTRLVDPLVLAISDAAVWATQVVGPLVALAAAVASGFRLVAVRRRVLARHGRADPRPPLQILLATAVPGVNVVLPGVLLTEVADDDPRLLRAVRVWWVLMAANAALFVIVLLWRQRDALQARADAVLLTACVAALGAAVAVAALHVLRLFDDTDLRGRPLAHRRLLPATGPADAPVAEIVPAARAVAGTEAVTR